MFITLFLCFDLVRAISCAIRVQSRAVKTTRNTLRYTAPGSMNEPVPHKLSLQNVCDTFKTCPKLDPSLQNVKHPSVSKGRGRQIIMYTMLQQVAAGRCWSQLLYTMLQLVAANNYVKPCSRE